MNCINYIYKNYTKLIKKCKRKNRLYLAYKIIIKVVSGNIDIFTPKDGSSYSC